MRLCHGLCLILFLAPAASLHAEDTETADAAVRVLGQASSSQPDGSHHLLLRSLRQMRDPRLKPLFERLSRSRNGDLKIHGLLGLAEIRSPSELSADEVLAITDIPTQTRLVEAAISEKLLPVETARQLFEHSQIKEQAALLLGMHLLEQKQALPPGRLSQMATAENIELRSLGAMLRLESGDATALSALKSLEQGEDRRQDELRAMLLRDAGRCGFRSMAPWSLEIASRPGEPRELGYQALKTSLQLNDPEAVRLFRSRFESAPGVADRMRLALHALSVAGPDRPAALYAPLEKSDQQLIQLIGRIGSQIATGRNADNEVLALLAENHPLYAQALLDLARRLPPEKVAAWEMGLMLAAENPPDPPRHRAQRLSLTVFAAEDLANRQPQPGLLFRNVMDQVPALTQEAILMGLIRSRAAKPHAFFPETTTWKSRVASSMALLLRARHSQALSPDDLESLSLLVRGGGGLEMPLRAQAAWTYVTHTRQEERTLQRLPLSQP